jgi:hypothetical protein
LSDDTENQALTRRRQRGVKAARRIEDTAHVVRDALAHAKVAEKGEERDDARRQLKKLRKKLDEFQRLVIREGLSKASHLYLKDHLGRLEDPLEALLDGPAGVGEMVKLAREARKVRKELAKAL